MSNTRFIHTGVNLIGQVVHLSRFLALARAAILAVAMGIGLNLEILSVALAEESDAQGVVRGLVKPRQQAILSSELAARVTRLPFRAGDRFKKGQTLVAFDCSLYRAQLASARAEYESKRKSFENQQQLLSLNATSNIAVEIADAEARKAQADVNIAKVHTSHCEIEAPYDGRVMELLTNQYESVSARQKLLSILNDQVLEIELIVPSSWLVWLSVGSKFTLRIDETRNSYSAQISEFGAAVDPVSQTMRIVAVFDERPEDVLAGMSGAAAFSRTQ